MLDVASQTINEEGITNASLDLVAQKLGLDKSSLYYYFKNKEDLIFKCYIRASEQRLRIATEAVESASSGRSQIESYMRLRLNRLNDVLPPLAFLGDLALLTEHHRQEIRHHAAGHARIVQQILENGAADGTLEVHDAHLTRLALVGALDWTNIWWRAGTGSLTIATVSSGYIDLFMNGLSPPGEVRTECPEPALRPPAPPGVQDVFSRDFQVNMRREALFKAASLFFNRHGYDNSTLDQIVEYLGISKGALYRYVKTKEDLLYGSYSRSLDMIQEILERISAEPGDGQTRFLRYISSMIAFHGGSAGPLANFARLKSLSEPHRVSVQERSETLQRIVARFIEQGVADGAVRPLDIRLARLALIGALNSVPGWYVADGANTPAEIAACFCNLFSRGLAPRSARRQ